MPSARCEPLWADPKHDGVSQSLAPKDPVAHVWHSRDERWFEDHPEPLPENDMEEEK